LRIINAVAGSRALLEATAYHEAGHAVVAWIQHVGLRRISIIPAHGAAGFVHHAPIGGRDMEWGDSPRVRIRGERLIRVCLAGEIAQRRFDARSIRHYHGAEDRAKAANVISYLASPGEHADAYMRLLEIETQKIVEEWWELIGALAAALITRCRMTGAEATAFMRDWRAAKGDA
jgi:hypothetical protein